MIFRILSVTAIVLNAVMMLAFFMLNPPATYERMADRDMRAAHAAFRKVSAEQSYAMYRAVLEHYPRSTFAKESLFFSGRTAFLGLGQFDAAEKELSAYVASKPKNEENLKEAQDELDMIRNRDDIPKEFRDEVLWEYVQAMMDESNGRLREASMRLEWITESYGASALGKRADAAKKRIADRLAVS